MGRRIKELRETKGLTQAQLAELIGKTVETVSNFERGRTLPGILTLESVARQIGVPLKEFFDDAPVSAQQDKPVSRNATIIMNSIDLLPEDDLEIIAGVVQVLEQRHRKRR